MKLLPVNCPVHYPFVCNLVVSFPWCEFSTAVSWGQKLISVDCDVDVFPQEGTPRLVCEMCVFYCTRSPQRYTTKLQLPVLCSYLTLQTDSLLHVVQSASFSCSSAVLCKSCAILPDKTLLLAITRVNLFDSMSIYGKITVVGSCLISRPNLFN